MVKRKFTIACAHRLFEYDGKCSNLHGHNYDIIVYCVDSSPERAGSRKIPMNDLSLEIDFGEIKQRVGTWLDAEWDHATLVNVSDKVLVDFLRNNNMKYYPFDGNPSAENMVNELMTKFRPFVYKVEIYETPNCSIEWND